MHQPPKQPKTIQQKLNTTTTSQPKHQLSKTHLITLFQTRKIKSAKQYITQLKNSNPRAQKAIKQSLEEIFCMKKVPSATAYMYALVFYKNLLISGEMDYYEDEQFFSHQIHQAVAQVCQYNPKEKDAKQRGADYFSYAVKIQQKQNQDLQATGKAVVVFSLQLLQTMGQLYKQSYLTGQQSFFLQKYNELLKKGVTFPKKQQYLYIKQQDVKQFQENYKKLLQAGEEYEEEVIQKQKKNQQEVKKFQGDKKQNISAIVQNKKVQEKKPQKSSVPEKVPVTQRNQKKPQQIQKTQDIIKQPINTIPQKEPQIKKLTQNNVNKKPNESIKQPQKPTLTIAQTNKIQQKQPLSAGVAEILKQVQQKKKLQQKMIQQNNQQKNQPSKKQQQISTVRNQKSQQKQKQKHNKPSGQTIEIVQKTRQQQVVANIDQKQTSRKDMKLSGNKSKIEQKQISKQIPNSKNIIKNKTNQQKIQPEISIKTENLPQKESINDQKQISSFLNKKSFKRTQIPNNDRRTPQKSMDLGKFQHFDSLAIQSKSKQINLEKNYTKHKHRIFEQVKQRAPKIDEVSTQKVKQNVNIFAQKAIQIQQQPKVSDSIVSFSPNPIQGILNNFRPPSPRSHKKSVPKTQKKQLDKTFCDNFQQLAFKLNSTQKSFGNNNKKSFDKFPTKTLSAWRCQKHVRKQYEPSMSQQQMLEQLWSSVKSKQIPFVPEYFHPTTLKMSALRRAALQLYQFTSTSEIFFNNNIISVRLMKPSQNYFILSLSNVSGKDMFIRVYDKKVKENTLEQKIKFVDENDKKKRLLRQSGFMDVRFVFSTNDLNFKFLTVDFEIDQKILTLQLPITLLDSCKVMKNVDTNEVSSLIRRSAIIFISQPFSLNPKDLPKFLSNQTLETTNIHIQSSQFPTTYFSVKLISAQNNQKSSQKNVLFCRINEVLNLKGRYELSILLESNNEETQNFAKVMMELLLFLLCE